MCVLSPGSKVMGSAIACFTLYLVLTLLELCLAVQPAGSQPQGASECPDSLSHGYGNILREGWKDLLDCLLALFKARLLPQPMVEVNGCHSLVAYIH